MCHCWRYIDHFDRYSTGDAPSWTSEYCSLVNFVLAQGLRIAEFVTVTILLNKHSKLLEVFSLSQINVGCELEYAMTNTTTFLFNVDVSKTDCQHVIQENLTINPAIVAERLEIGLEKNSTHRCVVQPGSFLLRYEATVDLMAEIDFANELSEQPYKELPQEVIPYVNPSRYCESDLLGNFSMREFAKSPQGLSRVRSICDWIFNNISYVSGSTDSQTTARDVFVQRQGVCRDFAHLAITLCRGLGIPARYVCGYAVNLQPPDFHGFFEAYLGERWYLFDATKMAPVGGFVRIAAGHDAADVPFATFIGAAQLKSKKVWATLPVGALAPAPLSDQAAISTV